MNANRLIDWLGTSTGGFAGNATNSNSFAAAGWAPAGIADFNGDGRSDILWHNTDGRVSDWLGTAAGGFVDNSANAPTNIGASWHVAGTGDFNGDGRGDILWRDSDGSITDWLGRVDGGFVSNSAVAHQPVNTAWQVTGVGDFDGDGRSDVLWQRDDGAHETWVGGSDGALLSPAEKAWHDTVARAQEFFDEITNQLDSVPPTGGADQNSFYSDDADRAPLDGMLSNIWSGTTAVQNDPGTSIFDLLALSVDPQFDLLSLAGQSFTAAFDGSLGSMDLIDTSTNLFQLNIDGLPIEGIWHDGPPPQTGSSDTIIVVGHRDNNDVFIPDSYFAFDPVLSGFNFSALTTATPSPIPPTYDTLNAAVAGLHAQVDSSKDVNSKEHFAIVYKDASGFHTSPLFVGTSVNANLNPLFTWMAANSVPFSEVLDFYHNHDSDFYAHTPEEAAINRYPSLSQNGGTDWNAADSFVNPGPGIAGADPSLFIMTIEDTDHVVHDFPYSQEGTYTNLTNDQMEDGIQLPSPPPTH